MLFNALFIGNMHDGRCKKYSSSIIRMSFKHFSILHPYLLNVISVGHKWPQNHGTYEHVTAVENWFVAEISISHNKIMEAEQLVQEYSTTEDAVHQ